MSSQKMQVGDIVRCMFNRYPERVYNVWYSGVVKSKRLFVVKEIEHDTYARVQTLDHKPIDREHWGDDITVAITMEDLELIGVYHEV